MGSNCDVLTLKRTSFSTFFVIGRSNHLPTTSAFFQQIPSVAIYTKKLEINLAAMPRGFESHRLRQRQHLAGYCLFVFAENFGRVARWDSNSPCPALCVPPSCNSPADCCKGAGESHRLRHIRCRIERFYDGYFLFAASNYNVVSLRKGYYKPKLLATKIRSQKPFVARIVAHSS